MLKTSGSTESTTRPGKSGVEVGSDGGETLTSRLRTSKSMDSSTKTTQIAVEYDGVDWWWLQWQFQQEVRFLGYVRSSHVVLTFRCSSDAPKLMCPPAPLTSMLRSSSSTDSSTNAAQIVVEYDGVHDGGDRNGDFNRKFHPRLHATQIAVEYDGVDVGGGQLVEKLSKGRGIVKSRETSKA